MNIINKDLFAFENFTISDKLNAINVYAPAIPNADVNKLKKNVNAKSFLSLRYSSKQHLNDPSDIEMYCYPHTSKSGAEVCFTACDPNRDNFKDVKAKYTTVLVAIPFRCSIKSVTIPKKAEVLKISVRAFKKLNRDRGSWRGFEYSNPEIKLERPPMYNKVLYVVINVPNGTSTTIDMEEVSIPKYPMSKATDDNQIFNIKSSHTIVNINADDFTGNTHKDYYPKSTPLVVEELNLIEANKLLDKTKSRLGELLIRS